MKNNFVLALYRRSQILIQHIFSIFLRQWAIRHSCAGGRYYLDVEVCYSTVVQVVRDVEQLVHVGGRLDFIKLRLCANVLKQPSTGQPVQCKNSSSMGQIYYGVVLTPRVLWHGTYTSSTMVW